MANPPAVPDLMGGRDISTLPKLGYTDDEKDYLSYSQMNVVSQYQSLQISTIVQRMSGDPFFLSIIGNVSTEQAGLPAEEC